VHRHRRGGGGKRREYLPDCGLAPTPATSVIQAIHHAFAKQPVLGDKSKSLTDSQIHSGIRNFGARDF